MIVNILKILCVGFVVAFSASTSNIGGDEFIKVHHQIVKTDKSIEKIMVESADSVFKVNTASRSSGSGFFISKDGLALTAGHVVDSDLRKKLKGAHTFIGNKYYDIEIIDRSDITDLALIRVVGMKDARPVELGINPEFAEKLFAIGYPHANSRNIAEGRMMGDVQIMKNGLSTITISVPTWPGDSGSPVFRSNGSVVGVRVAVSNMVNQHCLIVPSKMIVEYLKVLSKKEPSPFK